MLDRQQFAKLIEERLGSRRLVWAGLRREDAIPLGELANLAAVFGIIGDFPDPNVEGVSLERRSGVRVDPEVWDIDDHLEYDEVHAFRTEILASLNLPSLLVPYRSSRFLSSLQFARSDTCKQLGIFWGQLSSLEHKPWVETSLSELGIRTIPWRYIADEDQLRILDLDPHSDSGLVLRRSRSSGGEGFVRVSSLAEALELWPSGAEAFVSAAPYIRGVPVNIGAVVWREGVTVHHPSVQLIGIPSCTKREFGYCGNDFAAAKNLSEKALLRVDSFTQIIGGWLRTQGFLGAFGVDYLVNDDDVMFTEVNARFQGSTHASSLLSASRNRPCLLLEHVAAWLGIPLSPTLKRSVPDLIQDTYELSSVVVHWTGDSPSRLDCASLLEGLERLCKGIRADVLLPQGVISEPESTIARITLPRSVTVDGYSLDETITRELALWQTQSQLGRSRQEARLDSKS